MHAKIQVTLHMHRQKDHLKMANMSKTIEFVNTRIITCLFNIGLLLCTYIFIPQNYTVKSTPIAVPSFIYFDGRIAENLINASKLA